MQEYVELTSGHMAFLVRALDGEPGNDPPADLPNLPSSVDQELIREAIVFLRRTSLPIEPRLQWSSGGLPQYGLSGRIDPHLQAQPGKALCVWGDAGWGSSVRQGKYRNDRFSDDLVTACTELVQEWNPDPAPEWVTAVPSRRRPDLAPDFARRLAEALELPFRSALVKTENRPEQKTMANSTYQARNVDGSLAVVDKDMLVGPVLLVDDMVDSRWTFTVAAWLLRSRGAGEVWPLALAEARGGQ